MFNSILTQKRILPGFCLISIFLIALPVNVYGRPQDPAERQHALEVYDSQNLVAALPLLEKVAISYPDDPIVLSRLGFALYANSIDQKEPAKREEMRNRARSVLLKSQSLGDKSNLTQMTVDALSQPDITQIPFSRIQAAESAIREGEAAFTHGEMDKAITAYKRALEADPQLYDAALYAGDAEFKKGLASNDSQFRSDHFDAAGVWFAKAIAINANIETAYRYWGDALDAQGKTGEAGEKFVDAIVAEPYSRRSYVGLTQWAQRHNLKLGHPRIVPPNSTTTEGSNTTLNVDPRTLDSHDGSNEWLLYDLTRVAWHQADFYKNYPDEKSYRHSLKEEASALRMVAEACAKDTQSGKVKALAPALDSLVKLNDAGLLEAFILFARSDAGIARDYTSYRAANRDKLRRYWLDVAIARG
jgi:tetratricopeptide (TPR) repeat protein